MSRFMIRRLKMMYRTLGCFFAAAMSAPVLIPFAVMSIAFTEPRRLGLWSDLRALCASSPIVPSERFDRFGQRALTSERS